MLGFGFKLRLACFVVVRWAKWRGADWFWLGADFAGFMVWLRLFAVWWFACVVWCLLVSLVWGLDVGFGLPCSCGCVMVLGGFDVL